VVFISAQPLFVSSTWPSTGDLLDMNTSTRGPEAIKPRMDLGASPEVYDSYPSNEFSFLKRMGAVCAHCEYVSLSPPPYPPSPPNLTTENTKSKMSKVNGRVRVPTT